MQSRQTNRTMLNRSVNSSCRYQVKNGTQCTYSFRRYTHWIQRKKSADEKKKNTKSSRIFVTAWRRLISPTGWLNDIEMRSCSAPKIQLSTRLVSKFCNFRWIFFMFAQLYLLNHSEIRQQFSMNNIFFFFLALWGCLQRASITM